MMVEKHVQTNSSILLICVQASGIFSSYHTIGLPGNLLFSFGLPFSKPRKLQSLSQPVGVYCIPPPTYFLLHPPLVDLHTDHPSTPPLTSHPYTMDAPVFHQHPPSFTSSSSLKAAKIEVSLD
jgi:hypothetical protein